MSSRASRIRHVSDTAFWVAVYRAIESERKDALFRDPFADLLAGEYGKAVSGSMKSIARYVYWSVTVRTRLIDEYVLKYLARGYRTVINLGAGLDTRPYRLPLARGVIWIEVDLPDLIQEKNEKLAGQRPKCQLERVGLDLASRDQRHRLFCELNRRTGPALVLTEGVIPYLDEAAVSSLASDIREQPNFELWIAEYYSSDLYPRYQSANLKRLLGDSPFRFFPSDWFSLFENCGWTPKEMQYLYDEAAKHNRPFPLPWWASLLRSVIGEKRMMKRIRTCSAYVVFEKNKRPVAY